MKAETWHAARGYVIAVATVVVTCLIWLASTTLIGNRVSSSFFLMAIVAVNRWAGQGPGWLALLLGAIPVTWSQFSRAGLNDLGAVAIIVVYFILGAILNGVMQSERSARLLAESKADEALKQQRRLEREIAEREAIERELRQAETTLRVREAQLKKNQDELLLALDAARMGTWSLDLSAKTAEWSATAEAMLGYAPGEFPGGFDAFIAAVHPDDREGVANSIATRMQNHTNHQHVHQFRVVWPDASVHWLESKAKPYLDPDGTPHRLIGVSVDITERKLAEDALRESQGRLQAILDNTSTVIYLKDWEGRILLVNKRFEELFHVTQSAIIGKPCVEVFPAEFAERFNANDKQVREAGTPLTFEEVAPQDDGPHTYVSVRFPIYDAAGRGYATGGVSTDVTEQKRAEAVLREAEERFRTLATHAPIGIAQGDNAGSIFFVNSKWCELAGITPEESMGFQWKNFIHPHDIEAFLQTWQSALLAGNDMPPYEFRFLHRNGEIRWGSCSVSLLKTPAGVVTGQIATVQDITGQKRAAEALEVEREFLQHTIEVKDREQQLTAYEIHDGIVQHATAALMHIQGALPQIGLPEVTAKIDVAIGLLRKAVAEGRRVMNGIRTPVLDDLGIVPAIEQLVAEEPQGGAAVEFVHDGKVGRLAVKIEDALFRITQEALTNARRHSRTDRIRIESARCGDRVHLEIRDWGVGFRPPTAVRGVHGLKGMAERAKIAGGNCIVKSAPGQGTQVIVDLPYLNKQ